MVSKVDIFHLFILLIPADRLGQVRRQMELFNHKLCSFRLEHQLGRIL